jgi:hypothetical protein
MCGDVFEHFGGRWGQALEILLFIIGGLLVAFVVASCSGARSYFEKGRFQGMEEATREIIRGLSSHYELEGRTIPERVTKAVEGIKAVSQKRWKTGKGKTDPYHAQLWIFGDAVGEACWLNGQAAGVRRRAPAEGKVRIDLSLNELLQLSWLAHLGFQHMMPNYRGFEIHRFTGEQDALEGTLVVGKIESAIPARVADLSVQLKSRQKLIRDWWHAPPRDPYSMRDRKSHEAIT